MSHFGLAFVLYVATIAHLFSFNSKFSHQQANRLSLYNLRLNSPDRPARPAFLCYCTDQRMTGCIFNLVSVGYPRGTYPVPSADLGNRPWSAVIFLLLRADKKVGGEPQNRGGNYLKRNIKLVWPYLSHKLVSNVRRYGTVRSPVIIFSAIRYCTSTQCNKVQYSTRLGSFCRILVRDVIPPQLLVRVFDQPTSET